MNIYLFFYKGDYDNPNINMTTIITKNQDGTETTFNVPKPTTVCMDDYWNSHCTTLKNGDKIYTGLPNHGFLPPGVRPITHEEALKMLKADL